MLANEQREPKAISDRDLKMEVELEAAASDLGRRARRHCGHRSSRLGYQQTLTTTSMV